MLAPFQSVLLVLVVTPVNRARVTGTKAVLRGGDHWAFDKETQCEAAAGPRVPLPALRGPQLPPLRPQPGLGFGSPWPALGCCVHGLSCSRRLCSTQMRRELPSVQSRRRRSPTQGGAALTGSLESTVGGPWAVAGACRGRTATQWACRQMPSAAVVPRCRVSLMRKGSIRHSEDDLRFYFLLIFCDIISFPFAPKSVYGTSSSLEDV